MNLEVKNPLLDLTLRRRAAQDDLQSTVPDSPRHIGLQFDTKSRSFNSSDLRQAVHRSFYVMLLIFICYVILISLH